MARPSTTEDGLERIRGEIYRDFERACDSLYQIEHRDGSGLYYATLWPHQQRMARAMLGQRKKRQPPRLICLKTRRAGTSTASAMWTFHETYWRPRRHALTVAHHDSTTAEIYGIYRTLYEELPDELKQPLQKLNRKELACEAPWGSSISAQTAGYVDIGRGMTLQHVHLSEIDFYADPEVALDGVLNAVHMSPETSIIIESTANGADGWLHRFWRESLAGRTGYIPLFQAWFDVPEHVLETPEDFELTAEEREWMRQYSISAEAIYWYRRKMAETVAKEPWGGERKMRQEHPFTAEEAFQTSGMCIFPDAVLAAQATHVREPNETFVLTGIGGGDYQMVPAEPTEADFLVWERPTPEAFYALGVDIGGGVGRTESVVSIWRYPGYVQSATWASKNTSVDGTAFVTRWLAELYGGPNALVIPEINKDGPMILHVLNNLPGSYQIYRWRYLDKVTPTTGDNPKLGWETSTVTKTILAQVANLVFLRGMAGTGEGVVRDQELLQQMRRCIDILPGRRWAAVGGLSDRIIAALIAMTGMYLEYEGGSVVPQTIKPFGDRVKDCPGGARPAVSCIPHCSCRVRCCWCGWREAGSFDSGDEIFDNVAARRDSNRADWDYDDTFR